MPDEIPKIFIRVTPEAKKRWMKMCAKRGVKQQTAGTRLFDWIVKQDKAVQQAILNGGKTAVVRQGVSLIVNAEEQDSEAPIRDGVRPEKPAPSRTPEKNGK